MIPSSEQMAANIRKLIEGLAQEIARRVVQDIGQHAHGRDVGINVETHTRAVLLDWFLGDYVPGEQAKEAR